MTNPNPNSEPQDPSKDESQDPKSGENDNSKAITGAVEAGWNGSVAGTNDAFDDESAKPDR